jgi:hypothetical protein
MEFWPSIIGALIMGCLVGGPVSVFMVKPDAPQWQRNLKLLLPVFIFILIVGIASSFPECFQYENNGCWGYKSFFLVFLTLQYVMGLGWCELAWRERHKQLSWPLQKNLQYGVLSNLIILISVLMTTFDFYLVFQ